MSSAPAVAARMRIGRFDIVRALGRGAQGTVWLAHDSHLERAVAVKTLRLEHAERAVREQRMRTLLEEARIVSRLQHPNIVTLFDAGEHEGSPYLVFEYVEGRTLGELIRDRGRIAPPQAVKIALDVLAGIGYAHAKEVVHRDIKPGNIMLATGGDARVMDFGIARHAAEGRTGTAALFGTPAYMAPEYIAERVFTPASDLFSIGMLLYEMLAGAPAVRGSSAYEVMHQLVSAPLRRPSQAGAEVDERIERVVMQALARDPAERFSRAAAMSEALAAWIEPESDPRAAERAKGTLEFLMRRIRHGSEFPALSETIATVNRLTASENENTNVLCNVILRDFALTNKLLRVVNGAYYGQFGGAIGTVSRAMAILGMEGVRNVATSLMLFEHLNNRSQAAALKEEIAAVYFSGTLARQIAAGAGIRNAEEACVCAMFHRLGRLLVAFYLHDEAQAIARLVQSGRRDEARASADVLGISYEELGAGVARKWNFPDQLIHSMRAVGEPLKGPPASDADRLRAVADLSNARADVVRQGAGAARAAGLAALLEKFGRAMPLSEESLTAAVREGAKALSREAGAIGIDSEGSAFLEAAADWGDADPPAPAEPGDATLVEQALLHAEEPVVPDAAIGVRGPAQRGAVLAAGLQDITQALVGQFALNDVLRIILETMYRGIGFLRVLLFVADPASRVLRCRFGFGPDADAIVRSGFSIPLAGGRDIFHAAISQAADICIEDLDAAKIRAWVPDWYRSAIRARGAVLFPVMVNRRPLALIYADADDPALLRFAPEELNLLKALRNQAVLAVKGRS